MILNTLITYRICLIIIYICGNLRKFVFYNSTESANAIGLPRTITASAGAGIASTQRSYLADGTLAQVSDGTTTRLYLGDMVFEKAANGTVTLESAGWEGGRLLPGTGADKVLYVVKDHLGSVRVVKDGTGAVRQRFDYYPYGTVSRTWASNTTTDNSEKRYRFGGKEITGSALTDLAGGGAAPGAPYLDFGARLYSPRTAAWLSQDPMAEKYYSINPYTYCTGNPIYLGHYHYDLIEWISRLFGLSLLLIDICFIVSRNWNITERRHKRVVIIILFVIGLYDLFTFIATILINKYLISVKSFGYLDQFFYYVAPLVLLFNIITLIVSFCLLLLKTKMHDLSRGETLRIDNTD